MGDLNDGPADKSLVEVLETRLTLDNIQTQTLYNISCNLSDNNNFGTYKYKGFWNIFDQIIVSDGLLRKNSTLQTGLNDFHIYVSDFILEEDKNYFGKKPFRTYNGFRYNNGYSDHLPVYCDFWIK